MEKVQILAKNETHDLLHATASTALCVGRMLTACLCRDISDLDECHS